jgi:hypothetical protein
MPLLLPRYVTTVLIITSNSDCNPISFTPAVASTSGRLHNKFCAHVVHNKLARILPEHRETVCLFAASEVEHAQHDQDQLRFRRALLQLCCSSVAALLLLYCSSVAALLQLCCTQAQRFCRAAFHSQLKSKVGNVLAKATALRINLNIDGAPISSRAHTHPSHSQTPRLLFTSLSLGTAFPSCNCPQTACA